MVDEVNSTKSSTPSWSVYKRLKDRREHFKRNFNARVLGPPQLDYGVRQLDLRQAREETTKAIAKILPVAFGKSIERQVLASFSYLRQLRTIAERLKDEKIDILEDIVIHHDTYLIEAVERPEMPLRRPYVLAAFSVIEDRSLTLSQKELDRFIAAVAERERKSEKETRVDAGRRANRELNRRREPLSKGVWDGIDILAAILVTMRREGLKPSIRDSALQNWVVNYFLKSEAENPSLVKSSFGGSAGNFTFMLDALGLPTLLHVPYHHMEQAKLAPSSIEQLVFDENGPSHIPIKNGNPEDARRFSFVLQLTPEFDERDSIIGPNFQIAGEDNRPNRADRVILRIPNARTNERAGWDKLRVIWKGCEPTPQLGSSGGIKWDAEAECWYVEADRTDLSRYLEEGGDAGGFLENDWPYFPLFQYRPEIHQGTLIIRLTSAEEMRRVAAKMRVALFGGIQGLGRKWYSAELTELLRVAFVEQARALFEEGVKLHLELGEVSSAEMMTELQRLFKKARLKNLSLNRGEVVSLTSQFGSRLFVYPQSLAPASTVGLYYRAREILRRLSMETVYVHDVELAMLVRRNPAGEKESEGRAKLKEYRQAMLRAGAAVPATLIHRAKGKHDWDLVLSTESLAALLEFAMDYSSLVTSMDPRTRREDVLRAILRDGYYYPGEKRISVVVAPMIFIDFPKEVSLTGAGDFCFTVCAATAG